jgi:hypothetical protein
VDTCHPRTSAPEHRRKPLIAIWIGLAALVAPVRAQFPDLTVVEIDISPANPAPGQDITVIVTTENIGNAIPIDPVDCYLYLNSAAAPSECAFDQLQPLVIDFPPNTQRIFTFTVQYPTAGQYRLWAWLDACEALIPEWNENNNNLSRDVSVGIGDLTIDSIGANTPDPIPGELVYTRVLVRNIGPAIIDQIWRVGVVFQSDEPTGCTFAQNSDPFQGFAANSTAEVFLGPRVYDAPGTYSVWAWVDCTNDVVEASDDNNKLFGSVAIGRPDLLVDSVTPDVATPIINTPFDVSIVVRNAGSSQSSAFDIGIVVDQMTDPGQACPPSRGTVPPLAPGASATVAFPVTLSESRAYRIWGVADACDLLDEAREDNNTRSLDLNVGNNSVNAPDLVVESIHVVEIPTPGWGAVTTFDVTVRNVGSLASPAFRVGDFGVEFPGAYPSGFTLIGSPGPSGGGQTLSVSLWSDCDWRTRDVPALAPGDSATVQFWRQYGTAGRYAFTATADVCGSPPNFAVFESSELNNSLVVEFDVSACNADADGDGICDADDFCPQTYDPLNNDRDHDGLGDACDDDDDGDGTPDVEDCDPLNPFIHPGAIENCADRIDNNCDGQIDEGAEPLYRDADGDGFGDPADVVRDCSRSGYVTDSSDCDDTRSDVYPGANGPCDDGLDNDCDGTPDNEHPIWGRDIDGDGFTDPRDVILDDDDVCDGQPAGYILASAIPDPDDNNFMVPVPVVADPSPIAFGTPQGPQPRGASLRLVRGRPEPYTFNVSVSYGPGAVDWLSPAPPSGAATDGSALVDLFPDNIANLAHGTYSATLSISINGASTLQVPVEMTIRNPVLRVFFSGRGGGSAFAQYFDNVSGEAVFLGAFTTSEGESEFQCEVPLYEDVYLYAASSDCSVFRDFIAEDGTTIPISPTVGFYGPVLIDRDMTIEAHFASDLFACTGCSMALMTFSFIGLRITRRP